MITKDRQYRSFEFEQKDEMRVEGQAVTFETPTVMFEMDGIDEAVAREAMLLAAHKLPLKCAFVTKTNA